MKCPTCSEILERSEYEGLPVFRCTGCHGYLVATNRVTDISRRRNKSTEELTKELEESGEDHEDMLRCPRCFRPMDNEPQKGPYPFRIDKCKDCEFVWLDAGELARSQLNYESTTHAKEAAHFQDRLHEMTPEEKEQFEKDLARLPHVDPSLELLSAAVGELASRFRHRRKH